jgi:hypothetical protein
VFYTINGSGCALVQIAVKYNREVLSRDQPMDAFLLDVSVEQKRSGSCKIMKLNICARYNGADAASNMAVVAVNMVSGWIPDKASVNKLKNNANFGVKRVDIEKNVVNFYFDEFDSTRRCFSFEVLQNIIVFNTKPGLVHIYDYYTPGTSVFTSYNFSTTNCSSTQNAASLHQLSPPGGRNEKRAQLGGSSHQARNKTRGNRRQNSNNSNEDAQLNKHCPGCITVNFDLLWRLICNATSVYRVDVINGSRMRIIRTLHRTTLNDSSASTPTSTSAPTPTSTQSYSYHALSSRCRCPILSPGSRLLVLTFHWRKLEMRPGTKIELRTSKLLLAGLASNNTFNDVTTEDLWSSC